MHGYGTASTQPSGGEYLDWNCVWRCNTAQEAFLHLYMHLLVTNVQN